MIKHYQLCVGQEGMVGFVSQTGFVIVIIDKVFGYVYGPVLSSGVENSVGIIIPRGCISHLFSSQLLTIVKCQNGIGFYVILNVEAIVGPIYFGMFHLDHGIFVGIRQQGFFSHMAEMGYIPLVGWTRDLKEARHLDAADIDNALEPGRLALLQAAIHKGANKGGLEVRIEVGNSMARQAALGIGPANNDAPTSYDSPGYPKGYPIAVVGYAFEPSHLVKVADEPMEDTTKTEAFKPVAVIENHSCFSTQLIQSKNHRNMSQKNP